MNDTNYDFSWAKDRRTERFYVSKRFLNYSNTRFQRFGHRKLEGMSEILKENEEFVLKTTTEGFQQLKAKFMEDSRGIPVLWIQKWSAKTGNPIGEQAVLRGQQIIDLMEFLSGIERLEIPHNETFNVDFSDLRLVHLPDEQARKVVEENPDLVLEFARNNLNTEDIVALGYRRQQLSRFQTLLNSEVAENEWQKFFEENQWIFGYGLSYVFTTGLDGKSLRGSIRGASLIKSGKEPDGILKTRAVVSSLCLVEIKKANTALLKNSEYRSGTWAPTSELSGAVAQAQENVRAALDELDIRQSFADGHGDPTGEELMTVQPRSFLVVGNLNEFRADHGVNVPRFRAFEDFRRNMRQPEILTFDELFQRAKFIVESSEKPTSNNDEIPF